MGRAKRKAKQEIESHTWEGLGLALIGAALLSFLSIINFSYSSGPHHWLGTIGYTIGWTLEALFGLGSYILCLFAGWVGWRLFLKKSLRNLPYKTFLIATFTFSFCTLLSLFEDQFPQFGELVRRGAFSHDWQMDYHLGGVPAYYLYKELPDGNFSRIFGTLGVFLIFSTLLMLSGLLLTKISPSDVIRGLIEKLAELKEIFKKTSSDLRLVKLRTSVRSAEEEVIEIKPAVTFKERPSLSLKLSEEEPSPAPPPMPAPKKEKVTKREAALTAQSVVNGDYGAYKVPIPSLLTQPKKIDQNSLKKDLKRQAEVLEETLSSFGIEAKVGQINCGPTITSFEVHPAIGVKVQKIKTLENDIALNMEAKSLRILAPIPGKAAIGVEVPNPSPQEVGFRDLLLAYQKSGKDFHIPTLLGKTVNGEWVMNDLAKMPHLIIAGATGSGKSVCINTIVMSIVMNAKPDEVKLIMVDPKKVELTPYTRLPHMLAPVITEPQGALAALTWLTKEMEKRYDLLKQIGVRNIDSFNERKIDKDFEESLGIEIPEKLPFIVCIIDELADLMMVSASDIETPIARIAQMARAVGIHMILATQRPSREVITGIIKANFPTRIAFKVSSRINSQIILDEVGAESLLGNGDMLFLPPGTSHTMRAQGAFIRDQDINKVIQTITSQAPPEYVIKSFDNMGFEEQLGSLDEEPTDSLYEQAYDVVVSTGNASTTFLQRKLKIGYARAASLMDELEKRGIVGQAEGSRARTVLVNNEE